MNLETMLHLACNCFGHLIPLGGYLTHEDFLNHIALNYDVSNGDIRVQNIYTYLRTVTGVKFWHRFVTGEIEVTE